MFIFFREQERLRCLRHKYNKFVEEDRRRQERNNEILRTLERIESRAATLAAKTNRFRQLRAQYAIYLKSKQQNQHPIQREKPASEELAMFLNPPFRKRLFFDHSEESYDSKIAKSKIELLERYIRENHDTENFLNEIGTQIIDNTNEDKDTKAYQNFLEKIIQNSNATKNMQIDQPISSFPRFAQETETLMSTPRHRDTLKEIGLQRFPNYQYHIPSAENRDIEERQDNIYNLINNVKQENENIDNIHTTEYLQQNVDEKPNIEFSKDFDEKRASIPNDMVNLEKNEKGNVKIVPFDENKKHLPLYNGKSFENINNINNIKSPEFTEVTNEYMVSEPEAKEIVQKPENIIKTKNVSPVENVDQKKENLQAELEINPSEEFVQNISEIQTYVQSKTKIKDENGVTYANLTYEINDRNGKNVAESEWDKQPHNINYQSELEQNLPIVEQPTNIAEQNNHTLPSDEFISNTPLSSQIVQEVAYEQENFVPATNSEQYVEQSNLNYDQNGHEEMKQHMYQQSSDQNRQQILSDQVEKYNQNDTQISENYNQPFDQNPQSEEQFNPEYNQNYSEQFEQNYETNADNQTNQYGQYLGEQNQNYEHLPPQYQPVSENQNEQYGQYTDDMAQHYDQQTEQTYPPNVEEETKQDVYATEETQNYEQYSQQKLDDNLYKPEEINENYQQSQQDTSQNYEPYIEQSENAYLTSEQAYQDEAGNEQNWSEDQNFQQNETADSSGEKNLNYLQNQPYVQEQMYQEGPDQQYVAGNIENYSSDQIYNYPQDPNQMPYDESYQYEQQYVQESADPSYQQNNEYAEHISDPNQMKEYGEQYAEEENRAQYENYPQESNKEQEYVPPQISSEVPLVENQYLSSNMPDVDDSAKNNMPLEESSLSEDVGNVDNILNINANDSLSKKEDQNLGKLLESDTESFKQDTKVSNDSDFDFSHG